MGDDMSIPESHNDQLVIITRGQEVCVSFRLCGLRSQEHDHLSPRSVSREKSKSPRVCTDIIFIPFLFFVFPSFTSIFESGGTYIHVFITWCSSAGCFAFSS